MFSCKGNQHLCNNQQIMIKKFSFNHKLIHNKGKTLTIYHFMHTYLRAFISMQDYLLYA